LLPVGVSKAGTLVGSEKFPLRPGEKLGRAAPKRAAKGDEMTKYNFCWRTGRPCKPGAFDGGDGVSSSIDCSSGDYRSCPWRGVVVKNLTPHAITILREDPEGPIVGFTGVGPAAKEGRFSIVGEIRPSGRVARALQRDAIVGELKIMGTKVPLIRTVFEEPIDLPEPSDGVYLIVSVVTALAAKAFGRSTEDLLLASDPVRDANGKILGVRKFAIL
jgi:hypothetical protein